MALLTDFTLKVATILTARNMIRSKLRRLGIASPTDDLEKLANTIDAIDEHSGTVKQLNPGSEYTIPVGYHDGTTTVMATGGASSSIGTAATPNQTEIQINYSNPNMPWAAGDTVLITSTNGNPNLNITAKAVEDAEGNIVWVLTGVPDGYTATFDGTTLTLTSTTAGATGATNHPFGTITIDPNSAGDSSATGSSNNTFTDGTNASGTGTPATPSKTEININYSEPDVGWKEGDVIHITSSDGKVDLDITAKAVEDAEGNIVWVLTGIPDGYTATFDGTTLTLTSTRPGSTGSDNHEFGTIVIDPDSTNYPDLSGDVSDRFTDGTNSSTGTPATAPKTEIDITFSETDMDWKVGDTIHVTSTDGDPNLDITITATSDGKGGIRWEISGVPDGYTAEYDGKTLTLISKVEGATGATNHPFGNISVTPGSTSNPGATGSTDDTFTDGTDGIPAPSTGVLTDLEITPTTFKQVITPNEGTDGYSKVTLNPIPLEYVYGPDLLARLKSI